MIGVVQITFIVVKAILETMETARMTITTTALEAQLEMIGRNTKNHIIIITIGISTWVLVKENDIE